MHVCLTFPVAYNMAGKQKKVPSFVNSRNTSVKKKLKMRSQKKNLSLQYGIGDTTYIKSTTYTVGVI